MGKLSDLKLKYQVLIKGYPFRRVDWRPGAVLGKPLNQARIALVTTAGFYLPDQQPFDQSFRHDDCSYREIPWGTPTKILQIGQSSDAFDHSGIEADRNLTLPLNRLQELVNAGVIGQSAPRHLSIMGSIIAPAKLINESGPEIARKLQEDGAEGVLLAPVCPFCHQAAGLLQSIIEKAGIPTVSISLLMEVTRHVEPPRVLVVDRPLGYPLGLPNDAELQKRIMVAALALLSRVVSEPLAVEFES